MDAPPIQYARTDDGVDIAYWIAGEGKPLLYCPPICHVGYSWQVPQYRDWFESLCSHFRVACFDHRDSGLSGDSDTELSAEALALDFKAVSSAATLGPAIILTEQAHDPAAITFAAHSPELASHLVLSNSYASYSQFLARMPKAG